MTASETVTTLQEALALEVSDLQVSYGDFIAVERASFKVSDSECLAIVGPNGNGKSSIAAAIAGLTPSRGSVRLYGEVMPRGNPLWAIRHGLALVPERRQLFARMTVRENILMGCYGWTKSLRRARQAQTLETAVEHFPELARCLHQLAGTLSGGQQQMTALARGLAAKPRVLLLDEPCLGLAEVVAKRVYSVLDVLKGEGRTVILVEENPIRALRMSDSVLRVERGVATDIRRVNGSLEEGVGEGPGA